MGIFDGISRMLRPKQFKEKHELEYWEATRAAEGKLSNDHYVAFYTTHFGLEPSFYEGKRVLDVGCGPRGSLEWASMAAERVGLDPLADEYLKLGAAAHAMRYVCAPSEAMPFSDGHFDVVCSFNSLDHVEDVGRTVREICRVLKPGGVFLLLTDVDHEPTPTEPISFSFDIVDSFVPPLQIVEVRRFEKRADGLYQSLDQAVPYDDADKSRRYGILSAKLLRPS
jgi:SAM-dependent methyltransferase